MVKVCNQSGAIILYLDGMSECIAVHYSEETDFINYLIKLSMKSKAFSLRYLAVLLVGLLFPLWAFAQDITVTGTVDDGHGEPLIGARVQETGTQNIVVTDYDGNYTIKVKPTAKLTIAYVGFKTAEVDVTGRKVVNVSLQEDAALLDEVVVVGYGQMKRSDLTGAVVSVGEDAVKKSIATSIDQVLQGRAAGVTIQANSGTPGASTSIRIRGINTCRPDGVYYSRLGTGGEI